MSQRTWHVTAIAVLFVISIISPFIFVGGASAATCQETSSGYKFCIEDYQIAASSYEPGDTVFVDVTIENQGDQIGTVEATLGVQNPSDSRTYPDVKTVEIPRGEQRTLNLQYTIPSDAPSGTYDVTVDLHPPGGTFLFDTTGYTKTFDVNRQPSSSTEDPTDTTPTIEAGQSLSFTVGGNDPDGDLAGVEWYVDGSNTDTSDLSGSYDEASFSRTFSSPGTYSVEADVFDDSRAYNDQAAEWTVEVNSPTGDLDLTAVDEDGDTVDNAELELYNNDYDPISSKQTDSSGDASWSNLDTGQYIAELYGPNGDFWGVKTGINVDTDGTSTTIQRKAPRLTGVSLTDNTNGDDTYLVGETINIGPAVRNDGATRDVRVQINIDTDNDNDAEETVTRGDRSTDIATGDTGYYGYDYQPSSAGTKQIRVVTEVYVDDEWTATDDSGWTKAFDVQSNTGDLTVSATDANGNTVDGAGVVLYDTDWTELGEKTTSSEGEVSWSGLDTGQYNLELYGPNGDFWGAETDVSVDTDGSSATIQRKAPRLTGVSLTDETNGDGTYLVGETINIGPEVRNDGATRDVRVQIKIDTNNDGTVDKSITRGDRSTDIATGETGGYGYEFQPSSPGTKQVRVVTEAYLNGEWQPTDHSGWTKTFDVGANEGDLTVSATDANGSAVEGGTIVLYDDDSSGWNEIESKTTDSSGTVSWSDLDAGVYNLEFYGPNGNFWGAKADVEVDTDDTRVTIQRTAPQVASIELTDQGDGVGAFVVGETVNIGPVVRNDGPDRPVKVEILVDTDNDGTAEKTKTPGGDDGIVIPSGERQSYGYAFVPQSAGTKQVQVVTRTYINGEWILTDETNWRQFVTEQKEIEAQMSSFEVGSGTYAPGEVINSTVIIENTGNARHDFYVGYSFIGPNGSEYNNSDSTDVTVTLNPGESTSVSLSWEVPTNPPAGEYDAITAAWKDSTNDGLEGQLDSIKENNAVQLGPNKSETSIEWVSPPPQNITPGQSFEITIKGRSDGNGEVCLYAYNGVAGAGSTAEYGARRCADVSPGEFELSYEFESPSQATVLNRNDNFALEGNNNIQFWVELEDSTDFLELKRTVETPRQNLQVVREPVTLENSSYSETRVIRIPSAHPDVQRWEWIQVQIDRQELDEPNMYRVKLSIENVGENPNAFDTAPFGSFTESLDGTPNSQVVAINDSNTEVVAIRSKVNGKTRTAETAQDISDVAGVLSDIATIPSGGLTKYAAELVSGYAQDIAYDFIEDNTKLGNDAIFNTPGNWEENENTQYYKVDFTESNALIGDDISEINKYTLVMDVRVKSEKDPSLVLVPDMRGSMIHNTDNGFTKNYVLEHRRQYNVPLPSSGSAPVAKLETEPSVSTVGDTVTFDASNSEGTSLDSYQWDFDGDGITDRTTDSPHVSYTYQTSGDYEAAVTVTNTEGKSNVAQDTITILSSSPEFKNKAVYVWGYAGTLATNDDAANRFFERTDEKGVDTVFLSWGTFKSASASERAAFLERAHENDLQVHALIGTSGSNAVANAEETIPEVIAYNEGRDSAAQFDGIHLDVEPGEADLNTFLDEYQTMLDGARTDIQSDSGASINSQGMALSSAVGWWWPNNAPTKTQQLVEQNTLDYVVVMAYWDTEQEVRNRLSNVVSNTDTPYVVAVETQEFAQDGDERVTFYEEGEAATDSTLQGIADSPPSSGHLGSAYHYYQSSVSTWDALKSAETTKSSLGAGETVTVNADVLFDDNFPRSSHESKVVVRFEGQGSTYTASKTITPPGKSRTTASVEWTVPSDAESGEYQVTASLLDTTLENDQREAIASRSTPVKLDEVDAGTVEVETEAPDISNFSATNPSGETVQIRFDSSESLSDITVELTRGGDPFATLTKSDFSESQGTYTASYEGSAGSTYSAVLKTAADSAGNDGAEGQADTVSLKPEPKPPEATISAPDQIEAGSTVTIDASGSTDPDGDDGELTYDWSVTNQPSGASVTMPSGPTGDITLPMAGTYEFEVTVRDTQDLADTATVVIEATEQAPAIPPVSDFDNPPTDPDGDGLYEDVNGDGSVNVGDAQAIFSNAQDPVVQNNVKAFDYNGDGAVNVGDAQALFANGLEAGDA